MSDIMYTSSNIAGIPQFTKSKLLDIYIRTNESLQTNVELLQKIPNMVELAQTYFLSCLNAAIGHNITLHCLSDDNVIYAFCFVQLKGICNNKPYYKLSSLTVNPDFRESHYEKKLINNIIERFSPESGCIYGFVPSKVLTYILVPYMSIMNYVRFQMISLKIPHHGLMIMVKFSFPFILGIVSGILNAQHLCIFKSFYEKYIYYICICICVIM